MSNTKIGKPVPPRAKRPQGVQRVRVSREMIAVLEVMADAGLKIRDAARRVGMNPDSAVRAFNRQHTKAAYNQMVKDIRNNAGQKAFLRINHLAQHADSETVKLEANRWLAGVDGLAPVRRVEGAVAFLHQFSGFDYDDEP